MNVKSSRVFLLILSAYFRTNIFEHIIIIFSKKIIPSFRDEIKKHILASFVGIHRLIKVHEATSHFNGQMNNGVLFFPKYHHLIYSFID